MKQRNNGLTHYIFIECSENLAITLPFIRVFLRLYGFRSGVGTVHRPHFANGCSLNGHSATLPEHLHWCKRPLSPLVALFVPMVGVLAAIFYRRSGVGPLHSPHLRPLDHIARWFLPCCLASHRPTLSGIENYFVVNLTFICFVLA